MIKEVLTGIGAVLLTYYSARGVYKNCNDKLDQYLPLVEQNFNLTKGEFKRQNYSKVRELIKERQDLAHKLDKDCGMYHLFFANGRRINEIFHESLTLEKAVSILQ